MRRDLGIGMIEFQCIAMAPWDVYSGPMYREDVFFDINFFPVKQISTGTMPMKQQRTSRKPEMKFFGSLAFGSSSSRKNFMTCESCFQ
jgi:hypothetical protein